MPTNWQPVDTTGSTSSQVGSSPPTTEESTTSTSRWPIPQFSPYNTHNTNIWCLSPPRWACPLMFLQYSQLYLITAQPPAPASPLPSNHNSLHNHALSPTEAWPSPSSIRWLASTRWLPFSSFVGGQWWSTVFYCLAAKDEGRCCLPK